MQNLDFYTLRDDVTAIAIEAGQLLSGYFQQESIAIESKSTDVDLVSRADKESEEFIFNKLRQINDQVGFIGEESFDGQIEGDFGYYWVVDPLDGTSNFLSGLPLWSVSIALVDKSLGPLLGVVHAPLLKSTWSAISGEGTLKNGVSVQCRKEPAGGGLSNAMLATGFSYDVITGGKPDNIDNFVRVQRQFQKVRRLGSAAIDLAFVSDGTLDGLWELKLKPWDTAAGILLVKESGGQVIRFDGSPFSVTDIDLLAVSSLELSEKMQSLLNIE